MIPEWLGALGGILLVDLTLSGDNALVIGAAAAGLPSEQRRVAILAGGGGAIVLRVAFAIVATLLLHLPLLQAIGGVLLLVIAARLLLQRDKHAPAPSDHGEGTAKTAQRGLLGALLTILVADVTMSLDNILAVGALAAGNLPILAVGLVLSIALLLVASTIVAALIQRLPVLLDAAALVLGWTGGSMLLHDTRVAPLFSALPEEMRFIVPLATTLLVLVIDLLLRARSARAARQEAEVSA